MKVLNSATSIITLEMENNETEVSMVDGDNVEVIIIKEGAKMIHNQAFRYCTKLKELYLPRSITFIGDRIFKPEYSEVKIFYKGSLKEFQKIDYEREVYIPGRYDSYPYYSDYGATSDTEMFYRLYDSVLMYCEVYCEKDKKTLILGEKR